MPTAAAMVRPADPLFGGPLHAAALGDLARYLFLVLLAVLVLGMLVSSAYEAGDLWRSNRRAGRGILMSAVRTVVSSVLYATGLHRR